MKKETAYQRRGCSIFCKILRSLLLVLLAEMLLLIFAISTSRVTSQLNENAEDILDKQVENRANYLRQNLIQAQDLNAISGTIDGVTRELVDQGVVDLNTLDTSSEEALPLLQAIVPELVSTLRTKPVNGIFVILSTHDLNHRADDSYLPGLYIRDLDSSALSTDRNADLLAERAPQQRLPRWASPRIRAGLRLCHTSRAGKPAFTRNRSRSPMPPRASFLRRTMAAGLLQRSA